MAKKPNAANITHALAQLGGGGMMQGMEEIFKTGVTFGSQSGLDDNKKSKRRKLR